MRQIPQPKLKFLQVFKGLEKKKHPQTLAMYLMRRLKALIRELAHIENGKNTCWAKQWQTDTLGSLVA